MRDATRGTLAVVAAILATAAGCVHQSESTAGPDQAGVIVASPTPAPTPVPTPTPTPAAVGCGLPPAGGSGHNCPYTGGAFGAEWAPPPAR